MLVWCIVFAHLDEKVSLGLIADKAKISKTHVLRIIKWGMECLNELGVDNYYSSDSSGVIISVGKSTVKNTSMEIAKPTAESMPSEKNINLVKNIINYLNSKTNRNYTTKAKEAVRCINARISEGHTFDDFKKVIDIKSEKWLNTNMEDYLRPITLFGTKFNSYINERPQTEQSINQSNIARTIAIANKVASELGSMDSE
jgi:uncharacterized phage protein (TIGR02220 family)